MFFNKEKKKSSFVKAKTPEARKKQKQAIASYYAKKKIANKKEVMRFLSYIYGDSSIYLNRKYDIYK